MAVTNVNQLLISGKVVFDVTNDTVTPNDLVKGVTAHDKSGTAITGTSTKDSDTSDATAAVAEILAGKTAYARKTKLTGTMPNNGAVTGTISTKDGSYTVPQGYHDGSGKVSISTTEQNKIVAGNIKSGVSILGVTGSYSGAAIRAQTKTVTPKATAQTVQPDEGYDYLSAVTVEKIPYVETENAAGGITVTIG